MGFFLKSFWLYGVCVHTGKFVCIYTLVISDQNRFKLVINRSSQDKPFYKLRR